MPIPTAPAIVPPVPPIPLIIGKFCKFNFLNLFSNLLSSDTTSSSWSDSLAFCEFSLFSDSSSDSSSLINRFKSALKKSSSSLDNFFIFGSFTFAGFGTNLFSLSSFIDGSSSDSSFFTSFFKTSPTGSFFFGVLFS